VFPPPPFFRKGMPPIPRLKNSPPFGTRKKLPFSPPRLGGPPPPPPPFWGKIQKFPKSTVPEGISRQTGGGFLPKANGGLFFFFFSEPAPNPRGPKKIPPKILPKNFPLAKKEPNDFPNAPSPFFLGNSPKRVWGGGFPRRAANGLLVAPRPQKTPRKKIPAERPPPKIPTFVSEFLVGGKPKKGKFLEKKKVSRPGGPVLPIPRRKKTRKEKKKLRARPPPRRNPPRAKTNQRKNCRSKFRKKKKRKKKKFFPRQTGLGRKIHGGPEKMKKPHFPGNEKRGSGVKGRGFFFFSPNSPKNQGVFLAPPPRVFFFFNPKFGRFGKKRRRDRKKPKFPPEKNFREIFPPTPFFVGKPQKNPRPFEKPPVFFSANSGFVPGFLGKKKRPLPGNGPARFFFRGKSEKPLKNPCPGNPKKFFGPPPRGFFSSPGNCFPQKPTPPPGCPTGGSEFQQRGFFFPNNPRPKIGGPFPLWFFSPPRKPPLFLPPFCPRPPPKVGGGGGGGLLFPTAPGGRGGPRI